MKALTYLIYTIAYETLCLGGCGYVVFGLGHSAWWFVLAVFMSGAQYGPDKWASLFDSTKKDGGKGAP